MLMEPLLDLAITAIAIAALAKYSWSARGHFKSDGFSAGATGLTLTVAVAAISLFVMTWFVDQPPLPHLSGQALCLLSLGLFWWAVSATRSSTLLLAFDAGNPQSFVNSGPYRWVRHPFYASYILFWAGWALACWTPLALIPVALVSTIYVSAARDEERKFGLTAMADGYRDYRAKTGMFFPRVG